MSNMTSIEEIVKYQQELLNHQRNQKQLQKETIQLLNALNKNLNFMSDRLDEFALKTNIKLNDNFVGLNNSNNLASENAITNKLNELAAAIAPLNKVEIPEINLSFVTSQDSSQPIVSLTIPQSHDQMLKETSTITSTTSSLTNGQIQAIKNKTNLIETTKANSRPFNKNQKVKEYFQLNDNNNLINGAKNICNQHINDYEAANNATVSFPDSRLQTYDMKLNNVLINSNSNDAGIITASNANANNSKTNKPSQMKLNNKTINSLTATTTVSNSISNSSVSTMSIASLSTGTINSIINNATQFKGTNAMIMPRNNNNSKRFIRDMNDNNTITTTTSYSNQRVSKLLDTTNTNCINSNSNNNSSESNNNNINKINTTSASDESLDEDMSFDETDDEEKETIQVKKKPKISKHGSVNSITSPVSTKLKESEESNNQQRLFNKFVRESVEQKLGKEFLLLHEIQEINQEVMESIKIEALKAYPPINIRPRRAWHLAKASLRCRRRSLKRQNEKNIIIANNLNASFQQAPITISNITSQPATSTLILNSNEMLIQKIEETNNNANASSFINQL